MRPHPSAHSRTWRRTWDSEASGAKDESHRLGLPAFKILGASWAAYRTLCLRLGHQPEPWATVEALAAAFAPLRPLTLATATDGNHGRAVALAARWFGVSSHIYIPKGTAAARESAIRSEGAEVTVVDGSYDDAVAMAAAAAGPDTVVVSDTSWDGYTEVPIWVSEGYETIFAEADEQLRHEGMGAPDACVPSGRGWHACGRRGRPLSGRRVTDTRLVAFEPEGADCLLAALDAGEIVTVPGPQTSIMAGMNCGTLSMLAWPVLRDGDRRRDDRLRRCCPRCHADVCRGGHRLRRDGAHLASPHSRSSSPARMPAPPAAHLRLEERSSVLLFSTEGATDPDAYEAIVGRSPEPIGG